MCNIGHTSVFSLFFLIQIKENGKRKNKYKGGSLSLLTRIELRKGEEVGMLPNTKWEAAHLAT
jgi:hypothetical protein